MQWRIKLTLLLGLSCGMHSAYAQTGGLQHRVSVFSGISYDLSLFLQKNGRIEDLPSIIVGFSLAERIIKQDNFSIYSGLDWSRYGTGYAINLHGENFTVDPTDSSRFGFEIAPIKFHFLGVPLIAEFSHHNWRMVTTVKPSIYAAKAGIGKTDEFGVPWIPLVHCVVGQSFCYVVDLSKSQLLVGPELSVFVNRFDAGWSFRRPVRVGCEFTWAFGR
ncbi:MAG: hypothetical protein H6608_08655 [Flavobacteriales bacterium]|nr:hypothetical protein [Bacteroidota bacterium]MCB9241189.1 hypothetical protein [Flavobacteriales bacterium]